MCWIVGRGGAVYLTTDGTRFMRLPFPEMVDLVAVTATDDRNAIVSAADGRSWQTTDQGRTWSGGNCSNSQLPTSNPISKHTLRCQMQLRFGSWRLEIGS